MRRFSLKLAPAPNDPVISPPGWSSSLGAVTLGAFGVGSAGTLTYYQNGVPTAGANALLTPFGTGFSLVPGVTYGYRITALSSGSTCDVCLTQYPTNGQRTLGTTIPNTGVLTTVEGTFIAQSGDGSFPGILLRPQAATSGTYGIAVAEIWQESSVPFQV